MNTVDISGHVCPLFFNWFSSKCRCACIWTGFKAEGSSPLFRVDHCNMSQVAMCMLLCFPCLPTRFEWFPLLGHVSQIMTSRWVHMSQSRHFGGSATDGHPARWRARVTILACSSDSYIQGSDVRTKTYNVIDTKYIFSIATVFCCLWLLRWWIIWFVKYVNIKFCVYHGTWIQIYRTVINDSFSGGT